jgi:beta-lactamase class D
MMKTEEATMTYTFDEAIVSDLHKDAWGFRPSSYWWHRWNEGSDATKQSMWNSLTVDLEVAMAEEKAEFERAIAEYEVRLAGYISIGAKDRATAIRWLVQSLELTEADKWYGAEYICYTLGLPHQMQSEFAEFSKFEGVI